MYIIKGRYLVCVDDIQIPKYVVDRNVSYYNNLECESINGMDISFLK